MRRIFCCCCVSLFAMGLFSASVQATVEYPFAAGETLRFDIRKWKVKAGEATLVFNGPTTVDGRSVVLITFTACALNFWDEEKIYLDPKTFYPVLIERNLKLWGKREVITEEYFHGSGKVKIIKRVGSKTTEQVLNKLNRLDNIYCFIYRYRMSAFLRDDERFEINLPTRDVVIASRGSRSIKIGGQKVDAHFLRSDPKKYNIWLAQDRSRTPLRIDGAVGLWNTSLILKND